MEKLTLNTMLADRAERNRDKVFLHFRDMEMTYGELDSVTSRIAGSLRNLGIKKGDRVGILMTNMPEFIESFLGITKSGGIAVPLNPMLKPYELKFIISDSSCAGLIMSGQFIRAIDEIKADIPSVRFLVSTETTGGLLPFGALLEGDEFSSPGVAPDDDASLIYTSGTTGKPKGVILTHRNYIANAAQLVDRVEMREDDRFLCILPLFHVNAQVVTTFSPMYAGASMILLEGFSPKTFLSSVERYRATAFSAVPTVYAILLTLSDAAGYNLSRLRFCVCGAAPMPVEVFTKFEETYKAHILEGYGLSEGTCASSANFPLPGRRKIGSIGVPLKGQEMIIVDDGDNELPSGKIGEIAVRGENVMKGYVNNPKATEEALRNGWLHTGDLGYRDEDGFFFIVGRKKEMIIRGGENIYPKEVEEVIYLHPSIREAAIVGVPDRVWGEEVALFLALKEGAGLDAGQCLSFLRERAADYKCPRSEKYVVFMNELPKTPTGKIKKHELREIWTKSHE